MQFEAERHAVLLESACRFSGICIGSLIYLCKNSSFSSRKVLGISVFVLVAILFYVKYVPSILSWWNTFDIYTVTYVKFALLVGVSFIIFETISYFVDIYRNDAKPGSIIDYIFFMSLFTKIVSGPIIKWKDFQPQLVEHKVSVEEISSGLVKIIVGYAKKIVIADSLGASIAFIQTNTLRGSDRITYWLVAILYFFEIYYDFSGYSDVAIGFSKMLGIEIDENFKHPYLSQSLTEFWRRWHVSLGDWFRDYVYFPLGGNRSGNVYVNLSVVFLLTGIWHGANLTFLLWGAAHGCCVVFERAVREKKWYKKTPAFIKWIFSMIFVFFAWILFMSPNLKSAGTFYKSMFYLPSSLHVNFTWRFFFTRKIAILLVISFIGSILGEFKWKETLLKYSEKSYIVWIKYALILALLVLDIVFVVNSSYSPFIYMQF